MPKSIKHVPGSENLELPEDIESRFAMLTSIVDSNGDVKPVEQPLRIYSAQLEVVQTTATAITVWSDIARIFGISVEQLKNVYIEIRGKYSSAGDMATSDGVMIALPGAGARNEITGLIANIGYLESDACFASMLDEAYNSLTADSQDWAAAETFYYYLLVQAWLLSDKAGKGCLV